MLDMPWWLLFLIVLVPLGLLVFGIILVVAVVNTRSVSRDDYDKDLDRYL